jgi:uncharacterized protein
MDFNVLVKVISKFLNYPINNINFIWHGGEPLLNGIIYYKKILYLQEKCNTNNVNIVNSIQSNGTLMNEEWVKFFKEYKFNVGISFDGPKVLHDSQRINCSKESTFDSILNAILLLQRYKVPYGILSVVSKKSIEYGAINILKFYLDKNIKNIAFLKQRPKINLSREFSNIDTKYSEEFNNFMKQVFDFWFENNNSEIKIRELNSILSILLGGSSRICTIGGNCIGQNFSIETNGDIYHCDFSVNDNSYKLGNIVDNSVNEIMNKNKANKLNSIALEYKNDKCKECKWLSFCNGGCVRCAFFDPPKTDFCENSSLFEHIYNKLDIEIKEKILTSI